MTTNQGKGTCFSFEFPDGTAGTKLSYNHSTEPAHAYVYRHDGTWYCAAIAEPANNALAHYIGVPAKIVSDA